MAAGPTGRRERTRLLQGSEATASEPEGEPVDVSTSLGSHGYTLQEAEELMDFYTLNGDAGVINYSIEGLYHIRGYYFLLYISVVCTLEPTTVKELRNPKQWKCVINNVHVVRDAIMPISHTF